MSSRPFGPALGRYAEATEPTSDVRERALDRIAEATGPVGSILNDHGAPADPSLAAAERVRRRVARSRHALEPGWKPAWIGGARPRPPWRAPAFAAAALAALAIAILWARGPETSAPVPVVEVQIERTELARAGSLVEVDSILPGVELVADGQGSLWGTEARPVVSWRRGRLDVEVAPGEGIGLVVETDEGEIRVVGTGFAVERDLLGTTTVVRHGRVLVACRGVPEVLLTASESATCLPVTSAGLLGRARTLLRGGARASDVLAATDAGLVAGQPDEPVWGELLYLRMRVLADAGRLDEARDSASQYVDSGHLPRRDEALRVAGEAR